MTALVMEVVGALAEPGLVQLGAAVAPPELLPTRELHRALRSIAQRQPALANTCDPSKGLLPLRIEIARQALEAGCSLSPDEVIVTNGTTEALHLCLRAVTRPGDTVAVESPTYFGILQVLELLELQVCEVPTSPTEGVCLDGLGARLERARVKACLFMTNYSNPLGSCMPQESKRRLGELLAEREIPLIEDDIYGSLTFGPTRPRTAKAHDTRGLVLLCGSFTKTLAPGYRIGWAAPGRFTTELHRLKHTSSLGNPTITQLAVADFLATGGYERHLRRLRRTYADQMERMSQAVGRYFPAGTRVTQPQGGQVLWVELPGGIDTLALHRLALASGIAIALGRSSPPARLTATTCGSILPTPGPPGSRRRWSPWRALQAGSNETHVAISVPPSKRPDPTALTLRSADVVKAVAGRGVRVGNLHGSAIADHGKQGQPDRILQGVLYSTWYSTPGWVRS